MILTLNANPGQSVTLMAETTDGYGTRADPSAVPVVNYILKPDGTSLYTSLNTTKLAVGLYKRVFTLPSVVTGTYIASVSWIHPDYGVSQAILYLINVSLPFGNSFVSPA